MPKVKTHKGSAKRFRVTKTGKVLSQQMGRRHNLETKSPSRKRRLRKPAEIADGDSRRIKKLIPYR